MTDLPEQAPDEPIGRGIDRSSIADTVQQAFAPQPLIFGDAGDGLPGPEVRGHLPLAPPLSPSTFVCMADESEFVIRGSWGEIAARFKPHLVERAPNGETYVTLAEAVLSGARWSDILRRIDLFTRRVRVEPLRPQCRYLAQQMVDFSDDSDAVLLERLCTARRDAESFFMGLRDQQVHACELRSPRDPVSEERIRSMNETKLRLGAERLNKQAPFDIDRELERAANDSLTGLTEANIFGSNPEEGK